MLLLLRSVALIIPVLLTRYAPGWESEVIFVTDRLSARCNLELGSDAVSSALASSDPPFVLLEVAELIIEALSSLVFMGISPEFADMV